MKKNKTLFIIVGSGSGGLENYLLRLLSYSPDLKVDLVFTSNERGILYNRFVESVDNIYTFDLSTVLNVREHIKFFMFLQSNGYVNLVDFRGIASGGSIIMSKLSNVPNRIVFYRTAGRRYKLNFLNRTKELLSSWMINKFATGIFSNSDSVKTVFSINGSKYKCIPNTVEVKPINKNAAEILRSELSIDSSMIVIGNVSRNHPDKNHSLIFEMVERVRKIKPNIRLLCVGREYDIDVPKSISDICIFIPYTDEIQNYYSLMDLFFFPSKLEGYPNVVIEALLLNIPVLASDIAQIKELITLYPMIKTFHLEDKEGIYEALLSSCRKKPVTKNRVYSSTDNYDKFLIELK